MKAREYAILARAVEEGVAYGYTRAHKHVDTPTRDQLQACVEMEVLNAICEVFEFDDAVGDDYVDAD